MGKKELSSYRKQVNALLWERCSVGMKHQINSQKDFTMTIKDDPVALLKAVKQHTLSYQENGYAISIISDVIKTWHICHQKDGKNLMSYT
jgi:hypothetical protein